MKKYSFFLFCFLMAFQLVGHPTEFFISQKAFEQYDPSLRQYYKYNGTQDGKDIRHFLSIKIAGTSELMSFHEHTDLSYFHCHKYALAKFFGYTEMPDWIFFLRGPFEFDFQNELTPTGTPQEGDLVVYYLTAYLEDPMHVGLWNGCDKVISTWGRSTDAAHLHAPFYVPSKYGNFIVFYSCNEEQRKKIRKAQEDQFQESCLSGIVDHLVGKARQDTLKLINEFMVLARPVEDLASLAKFFAKYPVEKQQFYHDQIVSLLGEKFSLVKNLITLLELWEKWEDDVVTLNVGIAARWVRLLPDDKSADLYLIPNICVLMKQLPTLPDSEKKEFVHDLVSFVSKIEDSDLSDLIRFCAEQTTTHESRAPVLATLRRLANGRVRWDNLRPIAEKICTWDTTKLEEFAERHALQITLLTKGDEFVERNLQD